MTRDVPQGVGHSTPALAWDRWSIRAVRINMVEIRVMTIKM